jgi:diacylglycerol O-acyltransferase
VRPLTALDAQFLYAEEIRPAAFAHTLKVTVLEVGDGYSFEATKAAFARRLHLAPPFRWRLVRTPGDLNHPWWIEDPDFDLDFHVRRAACPAPGGVRELCDFIADVAGRPLDRAKPLWEMYVVEGLEDGCIATVVKMHHALADGVASSQLLDQLFYTRPDAPAVEAQPWEGEEVPNRRALLRAGLAPLPKLLATGIPATIRTARRARKQKQIEGLTAADLPPKAFEAQPMFTNGLLTPHRRFTMVSVPLADLREIRAVFGTTINDVVLAVTAGGLRRYLERNGLPADHHAVGSVPVSTRGEGERPAWGNHIAKIYVALPVDVADPIERLQAARVAANRAKDDLGRTLGARLENVIDYLPVFFLKGVVARLLLGQIEKGAASENLIVSNVPGPREPLYIDGVRVRSFFSMGPLSEGAGLNVTAWSYVDQMNVCLLACRELVPDLWALTDDLYDAFDELRKLAEEAR